MRRTLALGLLTLLAAACGGLAPGFLDAGPDSSPPLYSGLRVAALGPGRAIFRLEFEGPRPWVYLLETRWHEQAGEYRLALDGLPLRQDPGDVRVVEQNGQRWMTGPGVEDGCWIFPADLERGPSFLTPDNLFDPAEVTARLQVVGDEQVLGRAARHHRLRSSDLGAWGAVAIDIWLDVETGATLRYELQAEGRDTLFGTGDGVLRGVYEVIEIGPQSFGPVEGCDIDLPLPEGVRRLMRLPGLVAFENEASAEMLLEFYARELAAQGWSTIEPPAQVGGAVVMVLAREGERLRLTLQALTDGVRVELLTLDS
jgi:hypothetical protein